MEWQSNEITNRAFLPPRIPLPHSDKNNTSFSFLYSYNYDHNHHHHNFPGTEAKGSSSVHQQEKKKRLTTEQLDLLEKSFQEEIKLDPERKTRLSRELGVQPRQIAIWFQNRRARWKAKQLELLCDSLRNDFQAVSREKQKLQEEVVALRSILRDEATKKHLSTEMSGDETVESTSIPTSCNYYVNHHNLINNVVNDSNNNNNNNNNPLIIPSSSYWPNLTDNFMEINAAQGDSYHNYS